MSYYWLFRSKPIAKNDSFGMLRVTEQTVQFDRPPDVHQCGHLWARIRRHRMICTPDEISPEIVRPFLSVSERRDVFACVWLSRRRARYVTYTCVTGAKQHEPLVSSAGECRRRQLFIFPHPPSEDITTLIIIYYCYYFIIIIVVIIIEVVFFKSVFVSVYAPRRA